MDDRYLARFRLLPGVTVKISDELSSPQDASQPGSGAKQHQYPQPQSTDDIGDSAARDQLDGQVLEYLAAKFMKYDDKAIREYLAKIGSKGGQTRAERYDKETLSKWAKKGGRPRGS
jgi:hypothetical protein